MATPLLLHRTSEATAWWDGDDDSYFPYGTNDHDECAECGARDGEHYLACLTLVGTADTDFEPLLAA